MPSRGQPINPKRMVAANALASQAAATAERPKADASNEQQVGNSAKVVVGCKVPNGMILRLFRMVTQQMPVMGGGLQRFEQSEPIPGKRIRVNGPGVPFGVMPNYVIRHNCAFTSNVDREFWALWVKQNHDHDAVVNGMIFAEDDEASAIAKAKEIEGVLSGLQPMVPDKDLRVPKLQNENLTDVETEDERKKKLVAA